MLVLNNLFSVYWRFPVKSFDRLTIKNFILQKRVVLSFLLWQAFNKIIIKYFLYLFNNPVTNSQQFSLFSWTRQSRKHFLLFPEIRTIFFSIFTRLLLTKYDDKHVHTILGFQQQTISAVCIKFSYFLYMSRVTRKVISKATWYRQCMYK